MHEPHDDVTLISSAQTAVDAHELRRTIARIPAPVCIVTAYVDNEPVGFTASSFVNVSVEPPLVGVFVGESTRSYQHFLHAEYAAINVLADDQSDVATKFASKAHDKFGSVRLNADYPKSPVIDEAMASVLGRVDSRLGLGDHLMLVLRVSEVVRRTHAPLVYQDRKFRTLVDLLM